MQVHPAALTGKKKRKNWMPLESNPDLLNSYMWKLGVGKGFAFNEVYSVWEQELLSMIPQPVLAVLMLFPVSDASEAHREEEQKVRVPLRLRLGPALALALALLVSPSSRLRLGPALALALLVSPSSFC